MKKIIRTSTVSLSLDVLLKGQLAFLNEYFIIIAVSGQDNHLKNVKEREKVRTISIHMNRNISLIKDFKSLIKLYLLFKKEKPTIVHSITPKAGLLSMVAAYFAQVPVRIHTFTGLIFPSKLGFFQKLLIVMDKITCFCATQIYAEGEGVKKDLLLYKITKKPLKIIANGNVNGINTSYFNPELFLNEQNNILKKQLKVKKKDFVFIFVGRIVGDKGINELVNAFNKLSLQKKDVKLLLVGTFEEELDPLYRSTKEIIRNNNQIMFVGYKNDVRPYFAISSALVFPSYREGFPNVVLQAGAMGLPSIVSNINGSNEIIEYNKNGIIVPAKNVEKLYSAMKKLLDDKNLLHNLKNNAREMIVSRFEQSIVWEALLAEYKLLENNV